MSEKAGGKQRKAPPTAFKPGQSGNPKGKPRGCRHKATMAVQALLDGEAEALTRKAVEKALEGDGVALRLCLERLAPPRKDSPIKVNLPPVTGAADLPKVTAAILRAVGRGELTPSEGQALTCLVEGHRKALELAEMENRIAALEDRVNCETSTPGSAD